MKFREFVKWCNKRAADGCWGMNEALICSHIISEIKKKPFWKREKEWKKFEDDVLTAIVNPVNKKIEELGILLRTEKIQEEEI